MWWCLGSGGVLRVAEGLVGHGSPDQAGELAGDGDVGDGGALAVGAEGAVAVVQADLRAVGASGDVGRDVRGDRGDALADPRRVLVVPGGLDEQPAGVGAGRSW
jgi:hypothetical protein